jgi:uncharacterized protein (TIGR02391 family)
MKNSLLLKELYENNFFDSAKELKEVSEELATKGHSLAAPVLSSALIQAVKTGGFLKRIRQVNGNWKYVRSQLVTPSGRQANSIFEQYQLHSKIKAVALKQYVDGNYKEAIQNAFVEVIDQVKIRAGNPKSKIGKDLDGDDLMNHVFGCDNQTPKIKFNPLTSGLDKAEQRGLLNLFKGIVGVRDKKAHLNFTQNDVQKTLEYLSLASLLMRLLDEGV